jgi:hypothetical protein
MNVRDSPQSESACIGPEQAENPGRDQVREPHGAGILEVMIGHIAATQDR